MAADSTQYLIDIASRLTGGDETADQLVAIANARPGRTQARGGAR